MAVRKGAAKEAKREGRRGNKTNPHLKCLYFLFIPFGIIHKGRSSNNIYNECILRTDGLTAFVCSNKFPTIVESTLW